MKGSIILLNGASSAGKSTIAAAIQEAADRPFLRFSLDFYFFGAVLPRRGEGAFEWQSMRQRLVSGYYPALAAFANAGNDLVVDHIFETKSGYDEMMAALAGLDVFLVGVHCPVEELERRERERGDRPLGDAGHDLKTVHTFCTYDLEVDSTRAPKENAALILATWGERDRPRHD